MRLKREQFSYFKDYSVMPWPHVTHDYTSTEDPRRFRGRKQHFGLSDRPLTVIIITRRKFSYRQVPHSHSSIRHHGRVGSTQVTTPGSKYKEVWLLSLRNETYHLDPITNNIIHCMSMSNFTASISVCYKRTK